MQFTQYRIAIVTNSDGPSMQDLQNIADQHSVVFDSMNYNHVSLTDLAESDYVKALLTYDVVYYRTGMRDTTLNFLTAILNKHNIPIINGSSVHLNGHRKIQQALICAENNILHPKSYMVSDNQYETARKLLGDTFVTKPDVGSKGKHVALVSSQAELDAQLQHKSATNKFLYQELIDDADEYRVYTIGGEGVISYKRIPGGDDFRANLHAGGTMEHTEPERVEPLNAFCGQVAKAFEADLAGIDVLVKDDKYYLLEVNYQPGWENLDSLTGMDVSKKTLQFILEKAHAAK